MFIEMHSTIVFIVVLVSLLQQCCAQQYSQSSDTSGAQQYPRIKIAGPLGQLIGGNGISLGSGLGAVLNSLVSTAAGSGGGSGGAQSGAGIPSSGGLSSAYLRGFGSSMNGYSLSPQSFGSQSMSSPFGSMPSLSSLYATSAKHSPHSSPNLYPNLQFSSFNDMNGHSNDGSLYGQSSNSIPYNVFGSPQSLSSQFAPSSSSLSSLYGHQSSNPHLLVE